MGTLAVDVPINSFRGSVEHQPLVDVVVGGGLVRVCWRGALGRQGVKLAFEGRPGGATSTSVSAGTVALSRVFCIVSWPPSGSAYSSHHSLVQPSQGVIERFTEGYFHPTFLCRRLLVVAERLIQDC